MTQELSQATAYDFLRPIVQDFKPIADERIERALTALIQYIEEKEKQSMLLRHYIPVLQTTRKHGLTEEQHAMVSMLFENYFGGLLSKLPRATSQNHHYPVVKAMAVLARDIGCLFAFIPNSHPHLQEILHYFFHHSHNRGSMLGIYAGLEHYAQSGNPKLLEEWITRVFEGFPKVQKIVTHLYDILPIIAETKVTMVSGEEKRPFSVSKLIYQAPKILGRKKGFIAHFSSDEQAHPWLIKKQSPGECMIETLASSLYRAVLADAIPEVILLETSEAPKQLIGTKYIPGFVDVYNYYLKHKEFDLKQKALRPTVYQDIFSSYPEFFKIVAASLWLGNPDFHFQNLGLILDNKHNRPIGVGLVDLGRSLNFKIGYDLITRKLPGAGSLPRDADFTPLDILRTIHDGHYKMNSPVFLTPKFTDAIAWLIEYLDGHRPRIAQALDRSARLIKEEFRHVTRDKSLERHLKKIGSNATIETLGTVILTELEERKSQLLEAYFVISLQCAIKKGAKQLCQELLLQAEEKLPGFTIQPHAWLPEHHDSYLPKRSTVEDWIAQQSRSRSGGR